MTGQFKLLIGYDGSDCAEAALDDLCRAGLPMRGVEAAVAARAHCSVEVVRALQNA